MNSDAVIQYWNSAYNRPPRTVWGESAVAVPLNMGTVDTDKLSYNKPRPLSYDKAGLTARGTPIWRQNYAEAAPQIR